MTEEASEEAAENRVPRQRMNQPWRKLGKNFPAGARAELERGLCSGNRREVHGEYGELAEGQSRMSLEK